MKKMKKKTMSAWNWDTLVAAWRYYQYRTTIASATFPADIIKRYFQGEYMKKDCKDIADQFANVDHGIKGEKDWSEGQYLYDCDKESWCKFYAFCKAYCEEFKTVVTDRMYEGKHIHREEKGFYCEYTKRWYPVKDYCKEPWAERFFMDEYIKEIK